MEKSNLPWRPNEVAELQELWQDIKLTATNIGALLGRPRNSVIGRVNRMRAKEGEERWPRRGSRPVARKRGAYNRRAKSKDDPGPKPPPKPILPDRVTVEYTSRCFWTGCSRPKVRGNYCGGHAEIMYIPRRV